MAIRTMQFFMGVEEFHGVLAHVVNKLGLHVILYGMAQEKWPIAMSKGEAPPIEFIPQASLVFLANNKPDSKILKSESPAIAKLGWLQIMPPSEECTRLYMTDLGMKYDWYDDQQKYIDTNEALGKFYTAVKREFKRHLKNNVLARNIVYGGSRLYKNIYYASSAEEWESKGGELMQRGVSNVRFSIREALQG